MNCTGTLAFGDLSAQNALSCELETRLSGERACPVTVAASTNANTVSEVVAIFFIFFPFNFNSAGRQNLGTMNQTYQTVPDRSVSPLSANCNVGYVRVGSWIEEIF